MAKKAKAPKIKTIKLNLPLGSTVVYNNIKWYKTIDGTYKNKLGEEVKFE